MDVWAPLWGDSQSSVYRPRSSGAGLVAHENKEQSQKDGYCWLRVYVCVGGQLIKLDKGTVEITKRFEVGGEGCRRGATGRGRRLAGGI